MFSVIIPLYNKAQSITNTIDSVLNQSFKEFEVVVINDGSTDKSSDVVKEITDSRIRLINKSNGGVSSARNLGIMEAKYKCIAFLDGDDIWDSKYLETMHQLIVDFPKASFFACHFGIKNKGNILPANDSYTHRGYVSNYFKEAYRIPLVWTSSVIVKKECFDKIGFFDTKYTRGEDIDVWSRLARNYTLAFEPTLLSYYIQDAENRSNENVGILDNYFVEYNLKWLAVAERNYFAKRGRVVLLNFLAHKKIKEGLKLVARFNVSFIFVLIHSIKTFVNKLIIRA